MPETLLEQPKVEITKRYQWLIDLFEKEFGKENVIYRPLDLGFSFGIGAKNGNRRHAINVEWVKYEKIWDEDSEDYTYGKIISAYSLNDNPNKKDKVKEMIAEIKKIICPKS